MCGQSTPITCSAAERTDRTADRGAARAPSLSVVVPVFDNEGSLPELHERLDETLSGIATDFEIIYVNDGSRDRSLQILDGLPAISGAVSIADLERNFGQSAAVMAGFSIARGDILVTLDADLENDPRDIPSLVEAVKGGADLACGIRRDRNAPLITRRAPSLLANRLVGHALRVNVRDWGCGLNAVRSEVVRRMLESDPLPRLPKIAAALLSTRIAAVPVAYGTRRHGRSTYTIGRLAGFAAAFLQDFAIRRTFRRIVAGPSRQVPFNAEERSIGRVAATAWPVVVSLLCWSLLSALALVVRAWSTLLGRRPPAAIFRIRAVSTRAPSASRADPSMTAGA